VKIFLIRGVPAAMQRDGWWMNEVEMPQRKERHGDCNQPRLWHFGALAGLIALGDILVWQVTPGLSLAVFGAAMITAAFCVAFHSLSKRKIGIVAAGSSLALFPLVELVQPLSLLIAVVGLSAVLVIAAGVSPHSILRGMLRLWPLGIQQSFTDGVQAIEPPDAIGFPQMLRRIGLSWFFPASLGLVFVFLLLAANPIADQWLGQIMKADVSMPSGSRLAFWFCLAPFLWTVLALPRMHERLRAAPAGRKIGPKREGLINANSTARALVLFNAVFAVQTVLDIVFLYGDVGLPLGITYAEYAHRGAYPLLITALLAGGFALLTRHWTNGSQVLRGLLLLFVAQNVALVVSSLFRLSLYIEVYGLTHLRIAAAIWMGLVAIGLIFVMWQVWKGLDNPWMLTRVGALGAGVLYLCAFVSFDAMIARHNLTQEPKRDHYYICQLGDAAQPVILAHENTLGRSVCGRRYTVKSPADWREWGFRNARARNSLAALQSEAPL
jgi:hypothetical protein